MYSVHSLVRRESDDPLLYVSLIEQYNKCIVYNHSLVRRESETLYCMAVLEQYNKCETGESDAICCRSG